MRTLDPITAGEAASPAAVEPHLSRFVPDVALSVALIAVSYLLALAGGASSLFRDADAGWHVRAGERMLAAHALPATDPFSFTKAGAPWMAWEWLSDVAVAGAHEAAGLNGVALLYVTAIGAGVWMWFRLNWAAGGNFLPACLFAAPMLSTANLHWLARPHVLGWLFAIGTVWLCESKRGSVPAVFAGAALWANLHGSFILAPAIFLIYAAGVASRPLIWGGEPQASWRGYVVFATAALAGSLVNPYGWNLHRHVLSYLADSELLDRIGEFQSFNFHADGAAQIILGLMIALAGGFAALSARRPERFLLTLFIAAGALRSARMLPVASLVLLPLANGSISDVLTHARFAPGVRRAMDSILDYGSGLRAVDKTLGGLALVPFLTVGLFFAIRAQHPAFGADEFPVNASASVAALPAGAKLFSTDKFGGYLIYRFNGVRKVSFDGRSDFYGADFLKSYSRLVQARPGWQREFARAGFTHALLPPDSALTAALQAAGWTALYGDKTAVLLKGPNS